MVAHSSKANEADGILSVGRKVQSGRSETTAVSCMLTVGQTAASSEEAGLSKVVICRHDNKLNEIEIIFNSQD